MSEQVKMFGPNDELVDNFEDVVEEILISVHGINYYDVDVELVDTNLIPTRDVQEADELDKEIEVKKNPKKEKFTFKVLLPLLFFALIFAIVLFAGFYFINKIDLGGFLK